MRVMVTGGTGTVGEPIVGTLRASGHDVLVYAASSTSTTTHPGVHIELGDVLDAERLAQVVADFRPDTLVHAAAVTPDADAERSALDDILDVNVVGALRTLAAFADGGGARFIQISSIAAYGDAVERQPILREQVDDGRPRNLYELSKATAEAAVLRAGELRGIDVTCVRLGDVFGPGEKRTPFRSTLSAPFQLTALAASGMPARLPAPGRKEWIHTRDVAAGVRLIVDSPRPLPPVMNLGSGFAWSRMEWCDLLRSRWPDFGYELDPDQPNVAVSSDNPPMRLDRMAALGFRAEWDRTRSFHDYVAWWEETMTDD